MTSAQKPDYELLRVDDLHAFYGESHVLHGIDLHMNRGEVVSLLGRNGAGRSTTLKSLVGIVGQRSGSIMINGRETVSMPSHHIAHLGVGYCPEERGIFASLSVEENLTLPPKVRSGGLSLKEIYEMFPNLKERSRSQGTRLSGGEQQMLALARILQSGANFLLLDEITEGLAPVIVETLGDVIRKLRNCGYTILLVEQNFQFVASLADRHYIIEHGSVVAEVSKDELEHKMDLVNRHLGL